jgi:hypothetical protein
MVAGKLRGDILFSIHWEDSDVGGYSLYERVKKGDVFETGEVSLGIKYIIEILEVNKGGLFRSESIKIFASKINYPGKCEILATWKYKCLEGQSTTSGSIVVENIETDSVRMRAHPLQYEKENSPSLEVDSLWVLTSRGNPYPQNYVKILEIKENEYVVFDTLNFDPEEKKEKTCFDSDGGLNYGVEGYAEDGTRREEDRCVNKDLLVEAHCENNYIREEPYFCPNGCKDRICKE